MIDSQHNIDVLEEVVVMVFGSSRCFLRIDPSRLGALKQAVSYTRAHKSEPQRQNHREGAPQQTK
ncbi:MAG: hypothetical protein VX475_08535, partial [Myxococcota bacterium]|nr:hypothetical protein [Myxococcota bacterium]